MAVRDKQSNPLRTPAMFLADSIGLDFVNSLATPLDVPVDWVADGAGLLAWLAEAAVVPAAVLAQLRAQALPGELDTVAAQARQLREWFRAFVHRHKGRPLGEAALRELEPINRLLERDEAFAQVARGDADRFELRITRRWRSPDSLLLPIGEALAAVVCDEDFTHVKACEGAQCTLVFADHTRGRARRWCSMAVCGNRAKAAAHRQRLRAEAD
jgi:predicted RNA-binding Zn ribbon-like protein